MDRLIDSTENNVALCPFAHAAAEELSPSDHLVLAMPKRMVVQRGVGESGAPELTLFYGAQEVTFDEPHLFRFAETLATQHRFVAGDALEWGENLSWSEISSCLSTLIEAGILGHADGTDSDTFDMSDRSRPSPLPRALTDQPASWSGLGEITQSLAGRAVEHGWLELVIPIFRVAHMSLDADGRQVGEANVFPRPLRLDRPTEWMACTYAGTRYLDPKPMNVTALKAMRAHWTEMMMAVAQIRSAFLARFPKRGSTLTIGEIERLATLTLAVTTYQLVKPDRPVANGDLHPALSSLFRVTDGLRLVMHQMLFVPVGEPVLPPETEVSVDMILDYAERNFAFHSETGVCAGPRHFIRAFLEALVDGRMPLAPPDFAFSAPVAAALADIERAFDYGLAALRAHAALFLFWPRMARAYQDIADALAAAVKDDDSLAGLHALFQDHLVTAERSTYLGSETWRAEREVAYGEMFAACSEGLGEPGVTLPALLVGAADSDAALEHAIALRLPASCGIVAARIADFAVRTQSLLRVACACQMQVNAMLGRPAPQRPFTAHDIAVHVKLQGPQPGKRLPFLFDEVARCFGLALAVEPHAISLSDALHPEPH